MNQPPLVDSGLGRKHRLLLRWWRRLPASRQDRLATFAPLASVLLFLAAIVSTFWYLRTEEIDRAAESLARDTEVAQQQLRARLIETQEALVRMARELAANERPDLDFALQAAELANDRPELQSLSWRDAAGRTRQRRGSGLEHDDAEAQGAAAAASAAGSAASANAALAAAKGASAAAAAAERAAPDNALLQAAFLAARDLKQPAYSRPYKDRAGNAVFELQVPLYAQGRFGGVLAAELSVDALLRHYAPAEAVIRHPVAVLDDTLQPLAGSRMPGPGLARLAPSTFYDVPLAPAGNGLVLRGYGYRTSVGLVGNTLFWMVVALSVLTLWMLIGTWRHMRRRVQIQDALVQETNFRRAMENSMLTGMRAMDMEGRVRYVNPAFCAMTGFTEDELNDRLPPYPYWPTDRIDENARLLQQELQGRSPAGGIEVKVMRKNGSQFDARMYVSPLIDARGHQTGWMTSMTNITEAKRIRDQLAASHERFTTVLEGLEAAVSVLSVQHGELLFANRSYRLWFGADAQGHAMLAVGSPTNLPSPESTDDVDDYLGLPAQELAGAGTKPREIFVSALEKWFDVRARYLQWTDGRLAQMLIATDVTTRRRAEEQAAQQTEKAQVSSRLITMGEMASSVAHELNQPLTAITNYCGGMVSRVQAGAIDRDALVAALQKTARQAERAGQIIHRIRNFVKKSVPQRVPAQAQEIVEDAVELASIDLRRRNVQIESYVAHHLPPLLCDPILIEQVVLNLLKNAAEAIDNAQMPPARRQIELRVVPRHTREDGPMIEFNVTDAGPGLPDEVINRLYEAFFSTKPEGMGIGLSLCRSIVESHRGRIKAQNLYNGETVTGCRFAFTLPVDLPARADESPPGPGVMKPPTATADSADAASQIPAPTTTRSPTP